jgi:hypothetical protein
MISASQPWPLRIGKGVVLGRSGSANTFRYLL